MKQYDSYKDSGVEWIGKVPSHWEILPFKRAITINNGCDYKHVQVEEDGYPVIGSGGQFAWASQYMYDGEVVLLGRKGTIDKPLYYKGKFWTVDTMFYGIPKKNANCKYLLYQAKNIPFERYATATALPSMTQTDLNNNAICMPPLKEQAAIANYLDKKCSEIDNVISAQQKRIALLQELKQSVITHAVTKGLDPNVEMKDSGVEWIGEVPKHWDVMKTSLAFQGIGSGTTPSTSKKEFYDEEGKYWLQTGDLNDGVILGTSKKVSDIAIKVCNLKFYPKDSVVIAMYGATIGKVGILGIKTATNQACCVLPANNHMVAKYSFNEFLACKPALLVSAIGGGQPNISQDTIRKQKIAVPPVEEQKMIADYLGKKCVSIDSSISKAQHQVDLLQEYKQSLITEVVTGKRKVC